MKKVTDDFENLRHNRLRFKPDETRLIGFDCWFECIALQLRIHRFYEINNFKFRRSFLKKKLLGSGVRDTSNCIKLCAIIHWVNYKRVATTAVARVITQYSILSIQRIRLSTPSVMKSITFQKIYGCLFLLVFWLWLRF